MSEAAAADLAERVNREIDYCRVEYEMTLAEAVGVLTVVAAELIADESSSTGESDD